MRPLAAAYWGSTPRLKFLLWTIIPKAFFFSFLALSTTYLIFILFNSGHPQLCKCHTTHYFKKNLDLVLILFFLSPHIQSISKSCHLFLQNKLRTYLSPLLYLHCCHLCPGHQHYCFGERSHLRVDLCAVFLSSLWDTAHRPSQVFIPQLGSCCYLA